MSSVLTCHSDPAVAGEESRIISHTQPTKQQPEIFRFAQHDRRSNDGEVKRQTLQRCQYFTYNRARALNVCSRVGSGDEAGFKLRWREIDPALQTSVEKTAKLFQIASLRAGEIDNR